MVRLWRLYRAKYGPGLDGVGGTFADGRWHALGQRVVYFGALLSPKTGCAMKIAHAT
jgi:RES domain-containing protein